VAVTPEFGSNWYGLELHCSLQFPVGYPIAPPKLLISTEIPHSNKYSNNFYGLCMDLLQVNGYGGRHSGWSAAYTARTVLLQLCTFLFDEWAEQDYGGFAHTLWSRCGWNASTARRELYAAQRAADAFTCDCGLRCGAGAAGGRGGSSGSGAPRPRIPGVFFVGDAVRYHAVAGEIGGETNTGEVREVQENEGRVFVRPHGAAGAGTWVRCRDAWLPQNAWRNRVPWECIPADREGPNRGSAGRRRSRADSWAEDGEEDCERVAYDGPADRAVSGAPECDEEVFELVPEKLPLFSGWTGK
jgi:ubiquitin-protein ligase